MDPGTHTVYVANIWDSTVSVIDGTTRTVTATVPVGKSLVDLVVDPTTHTVYIANGNDNTASVIDGATRTVTATVPVGKNPYGVAVDPTTHTVYVAEPGRRNGVGDRTSIVCVLLCQHRVPSVGEDSEEATSSRLGNR